MRALSEYYLIHNLIDIWSMFILYDFCKTAVTVLNNKLTTFEIHLSQYDFNALD